MGIDRSIVRDYLCGLVWLGVEYGYSLWSESVALADMLYTHTYTYVCIMYVYSLRNRRNARRPGHFVQRIHRGHASGLFRLSLGVRTFPHALGVVGIGSFSASPGSLSMLEA